MAEIVKLVADAIDNTKQSIVKNTSVYIILNMVAQTNNTQLECLTRLRHDLAELK